MRSARLYLGNCQEVLPLLEQIDALVTDQPYGMNYKINARSWNNEGLDGLKPFRMEKRGAIAAGSAVTLQDRKQP